MASVFDLNWTTTEDLFQDLDLDQLYLRQVRALGVSGDQSYPYLMLLFNGTITIGLNLGRCLHTGYPAAGLSRGTDARNNAAGLFSWMRSKGSSE